MPTFQIFSAAEIENLRRGGRILRICLEHTATHVRPGITTLELDRIAEEFIRRHEGARPAFKGYHDFPSTLCISVNEECVHGLPGDRVLAEGDIVKLDGGVIFGDLYTDACITVPVGAIAPEVETFLTLSKKALDVGCSKARAGAHVGDISSSIQETVEGGGYSCVKALTGHGLGTTLHQFPDVPNVGKPGTGPILPANTIVAIEPITAMGGTGIREKGDGWTISTSDGSLSAHFEHTVLILEGGCEVLA